MVYKKPTITDHGSLVELTEACLLGTGGDFAFPDGGIFGRTSGNSLGMCQST